MSRKSLFVLAIACALSFATLFLASVAFGSFIGWLEKLSPQSLHLIQPLSAVATVVFFALGVLLRHRTAAHETDS